MNKSVGISLSELNYNFIKACIETGTHLNRSAVVSEALLNYRDLLIKNKAWMFATQEWSRIVDES